MAKTAELLAAGWHWHQAGDLPRAEQAYRQLLQQEPNHAQAWFLLGAVCESRNDLGAAAVSLEQAVRLRPGFAEALHHQGIVLARQGQLVEATAKFREASRLKPGDAEIQTNLGLALARQGECAEAVALFQAVLRKQPDYARAQTHLREALAQQAFAEGLACLNQGMPDEAAGRFRQALHSRPHFPEAHHGLGRALSGQGRLDEAIASYQQALRLRPDFVEAFTNLSVALRDKKRYSEAEACSRQVVRLRPGSAEAHNNLGVDLLDQNRVDEAIACFRQAVQLAPDYAEAHGNLGGALLLPGELEEAAICLREALRLRPHFPEASNNLGVLYRDQGRYDEALASYKDALRAKPDYPDPHMNAAQLWLQRGDFERGWAEYEWRLQVRLFPSPGFAQPRWDGSPLAGRTILLHAEQGLGDTIQFVRYARLIKAQGARVIVECQRPLLRLLARSPGIDELVAQGDPLPSYDVWAPLMSLPYHLGTRVDTIPANVPYLWADPALVEQWRQELAFLTGFKIGIAWQGSKPFHRLSYRSVPLAEFAQLALVPGVQLISLQKGPASEQLQPWLARWPVTDLSSRLDEATGPFMDTAAVMMNLDLVVTCDTSLPNLAGALGVPVWVALPSVPDWRWFLGREDSPWYPSVRLLRQEQPGDWGPVFQRIAQAVRERVTK